MKFKNYHHIIDTTFYFFICAMPFFAIIAVGFQGGTTAISNLVSQLNGIFAGTAMYDSIYSVIGADGVSPLLNASTAIFVDFICYIVYVTILHLIIDCVQFIPQLCHKFMSSVGGKDFE